MSLRYALLGSLADEPRTGYALLKHFEQSLAYAWPASHSQIYPELARLLEEGLIEQTETGARNSKTYAVTEAGLENIRRWLLETTPSTLPSPSAGRSRRTAVQLPMSSQPKSPSTTATSSAFSSTP
jgi:DNA-binding PadR family transcriptional regulator